MVIDSHLHIGLMGTTEKSLLDYLDQQKIDQCWLLTWEEESPPVPMLYQALDIEQVKKAWKNHPDRILPFYAPDPGRKNWKDDLERCLDDGFKGCGELKVARQWNDPLIEELLCFLDERKIPLIFHSEQPRIIYQPAGEKQAEKLLGKLINQRFNGRLAFLAEEMNVRGLFKKHLDKRMTLAPGYLNNLDDLGNILTKYPGVSFIGHGPHFWNNFAGPGTSYHLVEKGPVKEKGSIWGLLEKFPNMFCDISGFTAWTALNRDFTKSLEFLELYNRKVLFGTDNFLLNQKAFIENAELSSEAKENILYRNAKDLIKS